MVKFTMNGVDMSSYGIYLTEDSLTTLMCPVPMKDYLTNECKLSHGKQSLSKAYKDSRDITLSVTIKANTRDLMLAAFNKLCQLLYNENGAVSIRTDFQNSVVYHLQYVSCSQMQTFFRKMAKFSIKFTEPNPNNRT